MLVIGMTCNRDVLSQPASQPAGESCKAGGLGRRYAPFGDHFSASGGFLSCFLPCLGRMVNAGRPKKWYGLSGFPLTRIESPSKLDGREGQAPIVH